MSSNKLIKYHPLDSDIKTRLRQKIAAILTPEVRIECRGLAILVLKLDEYEVMMNALWNEGTRKENLR